MTRGTLDTKWPELDWVQLFVEFVMNEKNEYGIHDLKGLKVLRACCSGPVPPALLQVSDTPPSVSQSGCSEHSAECLFP